MGRLYSRLESGLNVQLFYSRLECFIKSWKEADGPDTEQLQSCGGILLGEALPKGGNRPLHAFLFGDSLLGTLIFITPRSITLICSTRQAEILASLNADQLVSSVDFKIDIKVMVKSGSSKSNNSWMKYLLDSVEGVISKSQKIGRVGPMKKNNDLGEWKAYLKSEGKETLLKKAVDITDEVSVILATQYPEEIKRTGIACRMSHQLMSLMFDEIIDLVNRGQEITNKDVGILIQEKHSGGSIWEEANFEADFNRRDVCLRIFPVVRSNGEYRLDKSLNLDAKLLGHTGIFLAGLGIQYKSYCSYVLRTLMVDPHPTQQANYSYLLELRRFALGELKEGVSGHDFYTLVKGKVEVDRPQLRLDERLGSNIGVEPFSRVLNLTGHCHIVLKSNMLFKLSLGFLQIKDPFDSKKNYSLHIADTVLIGKDGSTILCDGLKEGSEITFSNNPSSQSDATEEEDSSGGEKGPRGPESNLSGLNQTEEEENLIDGSIKDVEARLKRSESFGEERDDAKRQKPLTAPSFNNPSRMGSTTKINIDIRSAVVNEELKSTAGNCADLVNADIQTLKNGGRAIKAESPDLDERLDRLNKVEHSVMKGLGDLEKRLQEFKTEVRASFVEMRKWAVTDKQTDQQHEAMQGEEKRVKKKNREI
ncbi:hypothetical protein PTTG_28068 [Puccinia triticina 1-1 BBBD Race 1]|uniref:FACT complex subunit n=1 Tax=Puccinia triticina (isolate 1-1 / race 1 (BBBD)) TaxID=630390 RepID=A0A180GFK5_PUCT1|nr:hypothetical protein PTTG_28068 [Puccinia triticina 1-1 BBBD Race 1]